MRTRRTPAPHTSRTRAARMRSLVAALLAAPLALGTLAATALPAAAAPSNPTISVAGPAFVGEPVTATFSCPTEEAETGHITYSSKSPTDPAGPSGTLVGFPAPGERSITLTESLVFSSPGTYELQTACEPLITGAWTTVTVMDPAPVQQATITTLELDDPEVAPGAVTGATVTVATSDGNPVQGSVDIFVEGSLLTNKELSSGGRATIILPGAPAREEFYKVVAEYQATPGFAASRAVAQLRVKDTAPVKTTPTISFEPARWLSTKSSLVATVSGPTGAPLPTGDIQFLYNGKESLGPAPIIDGVATLKLSKALPNEYTVSAYYSGHGDAHYWSATSSPRLVTIFEEIEMPAMPVAVKISAPETAEGPKVKVSVSVTGQRHEARISVAEPAVPSGEVTVSFGAGDPQTAKVQDGVATFELDFPKPDTYTLVAKYSGDEYFTKGDASTSIQITGRELPPVTPPVTPVTPKVTVPATVTTSVGTPASFTVGLPAEHRPAALRVTGADAPIDVIVPASGDVTVTLPVLAPGTHEVVVETAASKTVNGTKNTVRVTVLGEPAKGSTTPNADLTGSTKTLVTGKKITLVARDFLPGETVAFYLHSDPVFLGTAVADENGVATLVVALPAGVPAGAHHVQATGGTSGRWAEIPVTVTEGAPAVETPVETGPIVTVPIAAPVAPAAPAAVTPAAAAPAAPVAVTATPLAATGAELGSTALLVSVLLGSGALLLAGRRRFATSAR